MARTNRAKRIATERMEKECEDWNSKHPVGTEIMLNRDGHDEPFPTKTRSKASVLSGHSAVIWLEEISGCYLLSRVTPST